MVRLNIYRWAGSIILMAAFMAPVGCRRSVAPVSEEGQKHYQEMIETTRTKKLARENVHLIESKIHEFQTRHGRLPANLTELVQHRFMDQIPPLPEGLTYQYDPIFGNLRLARIQPPSAAR